MPRHELTDEERSRGGHARVDKLRAEREQLEEQASTAMVGSLQRAAAVFAEGMDATSVHVTSEGFIHETADHGNRIRAAAQVMDRVLGRATQRTEHTGRIDHTIVTAEAREYLARRLTDRAARKLKADPVGGVDG